MRTGIRAVWALDADREHSDQFTYSVQASTDGGKSWQTLAVGLKSPQVSIDRSQFGNAKQVLIRIIATDGFRSSELRDVLTLDDHEST